MGVWGTPANFNGFRILALLLQRRRSPEANQTARCLAISWAATLLGALAPDGILPSAIFTLCPSLVFSYIGSITAPHSSRGHQPNVAAFVNTAHP